MGGRTDEEKGGEEGGLWREVKGGRCDCGLRGGCVCDLWGVGSGEGRCVSVTGGNSKRGWPLWGEGRRGRCVGVWREKGESCDCGLKGEYVCVRVCVCVICGEWGGEGGV